MSADLEAEALLAALLSHRGGALPVQRVLAELSAAGGAARAVSLADALFDALYLQSADPVLLLAADGQIRVSNETALAQLGAGAAAGQPVTGLLEPDSAASLLNLLMDDYVGTVDGVVSLRDGRRATLRIARPLSETARSGALVLLVIRDTSAAYQLEQALQRSRALASLGHLAADLADAVVNPLGVIQGRLELLLSSPTTPDPGALRRQLEGLREHAGRIERAVHNLQAVAVPRAPERARVPLSAAVEDAVQALGRRAERVRLGVHLNPQDLQVYADPGQLRQIVGNLLELAVGATPAGRAVTLRARAAPPEQVEILIEDEGAGLSPAQAEALRTADADQMPDPVVGLPLAITWTLLHQNGGQLTVEPREHYGVRYRARLPRQPAVSAGAGDARASLLVIDDDKMLCETVEWMLSREGFDIRATHSAEDALQLVRRRPV